MQQTPLRPRSTLAVLFALSLAAWKECASLFARVVYRACLVIVVLYSGAFALLVGKEFGAAWLGAAVVAFALAGVSVLAFRRRESP